jgi:hypothetical protein
MGSLLDEAIRNANPAIKSPAESHEGIPESGKVVIDENLPGKIGTAVSGAMKAAPMQISVILNGREIMNYIDQGLGAALSGIFG